ncbi:MAG: Cof-type HAD-IIB family hydrolase [Novosphingobium sp.]
MLSAGPPIRMVICDIDGTLVRHDKSLPKENVAALQALVGQGVAVSLISARPPSGMTGIAREIGLSGPFGAFNGGTIFSADGAILAEHRVPDALSGQLLDLYTGAGISRWLFAGGCWLASDSGNPHIPREVLSAGVEPVVTGDFTRGLADTDKLVAVCDDPGTMDRIEADARAIVGARATLVRSQAYYLDATALQANKGDGVTALAALHGVPLAQVAVIGDQANDVAMFRRAGLAIAMGQASAAVQAEAALIAASNEDAGVADAVTRFILPRIGG